MQINELMTSEADIMVFYANPVDSIGDDGRPIKGCSIHFLFCGNDGLGFKSSECEDINSSQGLQRGKGWLELDHRKKFSVIPAIYRGVFSMSVDKDGKPQLKLIDGAYKASLEFNTFVPEGINVPGMIAQPAAKK